MAGYINALVAATRRPSISHISPEEREAYDRVQSIARLLQERATDVLGPVQVRTRGEWLFEHIDRFADVFVAEWDVFSRAGSPENVEDSKMRLELLRNDIRDVLHHLDDHSLFSAQSVLNDLQSLLVQTLPAAADAKSDKEAYSRYWSDGSALGWELKMLAERCRSLK